MLLEEKIWEGVRRPEKCSGYYSSNGGRRGWRFAWRYRRLFRPALGLLILPLEKIRSDNRRAWKASLAELEREFIRTRFGTAEILDLRRWFSRSRTSTKAMFSQATTVRAFARRHLEE